MRVPGMVLIAVGVLAGESTGFAHPGGTDSNGCHVESATGIRHCHNNGSGEGLGMTPAAEAGLQVSRGYRVQGVEQVAIFGAAHLQTTRAVLSLVGFSAYYGAARVRPYIDISTGIAWFPSGAALVLRTSGGITFDVFRLGTSHRAGFLKLEGFLDLVGDGVNAEPAGVAAVFGFRL